MRFRTTLILLIIAVGLGAYIYFVELPKATQEAKKKNLLDFTADNVTEVTLTYPDRTIVLDKKDDKWRLTKPLDAAADDTSVHNLINAIAGCEVKRELDKPEKDLSIYGLDKPNPTIKVRLKDKELPTILVGKNTPVGFSTYVSLDDDKKIRLTSSSFKSGMDKQVKDLRDKTILAFADDEVTQIGVHGSHQSFDLTKKDNQWSIDQPASYPADAATVRSYLSTLRSMRAIDFPAEQAQDLTPYGLEAPRLAVVLHLGKNEQKTLLVGKENEKKEIFVKVAETPTIYTVSNWVFRDLDKNLKDFRDKTILAFDQDAVRAVEVKYADGRSVKLVRSQDGKWSVEGAGAAKSLETAISQYLSDAHDLKGYDIAADKPASLADFGLQPPLISIAFTGAKDAPLGTMLLGRRQTDAKKTEYTAMAQGGETVFLVRDYLFTRLNKDPKDFVEQPTPTATSAARPTPTTAAAPAFKSMTPGATAAGGAPAR
jgi:Domain of unknown function (DUF4340)